MVRYLKNRGKKFLNIFRWNEYRYTIGFKHYHFLPLSD